MTTLQDLESARDVMQSNLNALNAAIVVQLKKTLVACTSNILGSGCGQALQIGELTYIQTHWYETPHGCMGGDTWHEAEGRFECPRCGHMNRLYDRPEIEKLKPHFNNTVNKYRD